MIKWRPISNDRLLVAEVPPRGASWSEIVSFAATFNAYQHYEEPWTHSDWSQGIPIDEYVENVRRRGGTDKAWEVYGLVDARYRTHGRWEGTLTELRAYLFMYWRDLHWAEAKPDLVKVYDLLDVIRSMVAEGRLE
jgi:hypothetical protein